MDEIGSEFWLYEADVSRDHEEKILPENARLCSSGRGAIRLVLQIINNKLSTKTALLPAYICDSVIRPFIDEGYQVSFYDVLPDLSPCIESLNREKEKETSVFLYLGYYGFDAAANGIIKEFKSRGTFIIEDRTHSLFSRPQNETYNDFSVASVRKWAGMPSGAFLSPGGGDLINLPSLSAEFIRLRTEGLQTKREYLLNGSAGLKQSYLKAFSDAQDLLNADSVCYDIDALSRKVIEGLDVETMISRRRRNYLSLLALLKDSRLVHPVFNHLPGHVTPLFFPVYVEGNRDRLRSYLTQSNVYCPVHWPVPQLVKDSQNHGSEIIYRQIMSIPIDQRYHKGHMVRIADLINNF